MGIISRRQKLELQPPVQTTFPLSSPITEEISSPSCSSAEDRELERTRPFDFLVKATKQRVEKSQKDEYKSPRLSAHRDKHTCDNSRLSVGGITKKRRNIPKPVGLNLVTNFSESPQNTPENTATAPLVDLNDLKLLSKTREKERFIQKAKNVTKKRQSRALLQITDRIQSPDTQDQISFLGASPGNPSNRQPNHGLSPSDRQVMIGLTVPCHESLDRSRELDSAGDQHTPLTPSIIVTPAYEEAPWSSSSPESLRPRATSSVYSQPTPRLEWQDPDIPPVPAIPEENALAKKTADPEFLRAHLAAMTRKNKSSSAETILTTESPDHGHFPTGHSDSPQTPRTPFGAHSDANRPESQGWWTYLLSPLLTGRSSMWSRKSPTSPRFPSEGQSTTQTAQGPTKEWWEKETSCFSPETPETAVTLGWGDEKKSTEQSRSLPGDDEATVSSKRRTVISSMFPGGPIQGEAAEYYQACAHELFSRKPYFECCDHICSITPPEVVAARFAEVGADAEADTGDRDIDIAVANAQTETRGHGKSGSISSGAPRGFLIDVESPIEASKGEERIKGDPPRVSTIMDNNEKSLPESPQEESTRKAVFEPPPVHEPAPEPMAPPPPPAPEPAPAPPPPQITNNIHHAPPPAIEIPPAPAPVIVDREVPHYIPPFQSNNPYQPSPPEQMQRGPEMPPVAPVPMPEEPPKEWYTAPPVSHDPPQEADITKAPLERKMPSLGLQTQDHPTEPEAQRGLHEASPMTPGFQRAAGGPGAIPLSEVNAPAPAYAQHTRDVPLPQRYDYHSNFVPPEPMANPMNPAGIIGPAEAQRRRLEREDAIGRKVGGFWRGRGPFSNKGCFGRPGREGRNRRRWYLLIGAFFLIIVIVAIALATTLTRKSDSTPVQSRWANLTGYPPMPTGIATIAGAEQQFEKTSCTTTPNLWSCALPKGDLQTTNRPYSAHEPSFRVEILFRNGTYANSTTTAGSNSTNLHRRDNQTPSPSPPSTADQIFLGNTTDDISEPFNGEETPFYMTFMSSAHVPMGSIFKRSNSSIDANSTSIIIPPPAENSDGTVPAAVMYPLPSSQPVRLYNRGKSTEHYGFYTYFDKSIFLSSESTLGHTPNEGQAEDRDGGSTQENAHARCTWSQTRFLVQIWTQSSKLNYSLLPPAGNRNGTSTSSGATAITTSSTATSSSSATDYTQPGSFPYPVTITEDRHGGDPDKKSLYCYGVVDAGQHYNISNSKLQLESRDSGGGKLVNPAPNPPSAYGGIDGGSGGCSCQWTNWIASS